MNVHRAVRAVKETATKEKSTSKYPSMKQRKRPKLRLLTVTKWLMSASNLRARQARTLDSQRTYWSCPAQMATSGKVSNFCVSNTPRNRKAAAVTVPAGHENTYLGNIGNENSGKGTS